MEYTLFHFICLWLFFLCISFVASFLWVVMTAIAVCKIIKTEFYND